MYFAPFLHPISKGEGNASQITLLVSFSCQAPHLISFQRILHSFDVSDQVITAGWVGHLESGRDEFLMLQFCFAAEDPADSFRSLGRNLSVEGNVLHHVDQTSAVFLIGGPCLYLLLVAAYVIDDDGQLGEICLDVGDGLQFFARKM